MSQDEQMLAMGRAMTEYAAVKQRLAALHVEAQRFAKTMESLSWYLQSDPERVHTSNLRSGSPAPSLETFPTAEQVQAIIDEALAARKRKAELFATLKQFGFEPKD